MEAKVIRRISLNRQVAEKPSKTESENESEEFSPALLGCSASWRFNLFYKRSQS